VLSTDINAELVAGVYHYLPHEHALERRCRFAGEVLATVVAAVAPGGTLVGLSSVHWREAWKYGERGFRYCQHDAGHAIASLRLAARVLGWRLRVLPSPSDALAGALLGLDRRDDFAHAEPEHPDGLMLLDPIGRPATDIDLGEDLAAAVGSAEWCGRANLLSPAHVPWPAMQGVAEAAAKPKGRSAAGRHMQPTCAPVALVDVATEPAADAARIIRHQRSAVAMDGRTRITRASFFRTLARTMPDPGRPPWDAWPWPAAVLLGLFVHRADGLATWSCLVAMRQFWPAQSRRATPRPSVSAVWVSYARDCLFSDPWPLSFS
jgi:nitroreductase